MKKRSHSKLLSGILFTGLVFAMILVSGLSTTVQAAVPGLSSSRYLKTYPISTGNNTPAYSNLQCTSRKGTIYASDEIRIYQIGSNWAYCSYPISSGRKYAYIRLSAVSPANYSANSTAKAKVNVYRRSNLSQYYGYVDSGDGVWTIGQTGSSVQVIYPTGSTYKMGWVSYSNYVNYLNSSNSGGQTISEGTYMIESGNSSNRVLDIHDNSMNNGGNLEIYQKNNTNNQRFQAAYVGNGYYTFQVVHSGKYLDVNGASTAAGTNAQQWEYNGSAAQQWKPIAAGGGYYYLQSKVGTYLDNSGGRTNNANNVILYSFNGSGAQKWKFVASNSASGSNASSKAQQVASYELSQVGNADYRGNNNVKYNTWYYGRTINGSGYAWCCAFQSYCANQCGISTSVVPKTASCTSMMNYYKNSGRFYSRGTYSPKVGDLVFYGYSSSSSSHIGMIVGGTQNGYLNVVEGNVKDPTGRTSNYVVYHFTANAKRRTDSGYVIGYASPNY